MFYSAVAFKKCRELSNRREKEILETQSHIKTSICLALWFVYRSESDIRGKEGGGERGGRKFLKFSYPLKSARKRRDKLKKVVVTFLRDYRE